MRVYLQKKDTDLVVSFEGASSSLRERFLKESQVCLKISNAIVDKRPTSLIVDFRDLVLIDGVCFRALLVYLGVLSSMMPVKLVGPGQGLRRLYDVLSSLPKIRFYPTVAACQSSQTQSLNVRSRDWQAFLSGFDMNVARRIGVENISEDSAGSFVIDLEEEADYLRSEQNSDPEIAHG